MKKLKFYLMLLPILLVSSCENKKVVEVEEIPVVIEIEPLSKLSSGSNTISFTECGEGETALLFLHGWNIDKSYWGQQLEYFCSKYRVITIDLPGYGDSDKKRENWTIESFGQDVANVIDQMNSDNIVLIGHSMSGDIALEAAIMRSDKVKAVVGVDNFKEVGTDYPPEVLEEIDGFLKMLEDDYANIAPAYAAGALFHPSTDSIIVDRILSDFSTSDPIVGSSTLKNLIEYMLLESDQLKKLKQKLYLINSNASPTSTAGLEATGVSYFVFDIDSTGHYPMIEKPNEFNQLLDSALYMILN